MKNPSRMLDRMAWLPIPVLFVTMIALKAANRPTAYESPVLLLALNIVCTALGSLLIAWLVGRGFLARPTPGLLLLGCGVIAWSGAGLAGVLAGIMGTEHGQIDINLLVTIHNLCVLLSGMCHLSGAVISIRFGRDLRPAWLWLMAAYLMVAGVVGLIAVSVLVRWTPVFFIQGMGGTQVRSFVLGSSIAMFLLSSLLFGAKDRGPVAPFMTWYKLALALIAVGLFGIMIETVHASLLSWTGRVAQFLGGIYMLAAALALVGVTGTKGVALDLCPDRSRYRYGVAVAIVATSVAARLLLLHGLGINTPFLTFYPAVILSALYGGLGPGLLATALSAALADYLFLQPVGQMAVSSSTNALSLGVFVMSGSMISWITNAMLLAEVRLRTLAMEVEARSRVDAERRRADAKLEEGEAKFRTMVDAMPQLAWMARPDGHVFWYNRRWYDYTGGTPERMEGWGWQSVHDAGLLPEILDRWKSALATGELLEMSFPLRRADGTFRTFLTRVCPLKNKEGRVLQWFGTNTDISDIERTEAERQKLASLAEQSPEFIGMCDMELKPFYVNKAAIRLVGMESSEQLCRTPVTEFFFPEDRAFIAGEFFPRVMREGSAEVEIRFRHFRTGDPIWMLYNVFLLRDPAGRPVGYATVSRDISERKQTEEELARFNSVAVGRELRMVELKQEINALCAAAGRPPQYDLDFAEQLYEIKT